MQAIYQPSHHASSPVYLPPALPWLSSSVASLCCICDAHNLARLVLWSFLHSESVNHGSFLACAAEILRAGSGCTQASKNDRHFCPCFDFRCVPSLAAAPSVLNLCLQIFAYTSSSLGASKGVLP